ncbi:unnamed protein product [Merluccius merluccius]
MDESGIQKRPPRDPAPLLRSITLPVDKVLQAAAPAVGVQNPVHSERRLAINEPGGWRGRERREQWADKDGFEQGNMKGWVDSESAGKLETVMGVITFSTTKGPMYLGDSFFETAFNRRSLVVSHTLSPME